MKIAWFTPFHTRSAIGQISKLVCDEIQKNYDLDIFTFNQDETISTSIRVIKYKASDFSTKYLEHYDYVIYNIGNYAGNHKEIWEVMCQYPGILVLHDQLMQNFFYQITMVPEYGGNSITGEQEYLELMRTCYGERGTIVGKALFTPYIGEGKQRIWNSDAAKAYPLLEPVLAKSTAVFSHANFFIQKIKEVFYGPTGFAYLPHLIKSNQSDMHIPGEIIEGNKKLVVSTGLVHPIKRISQVAEMLLVNPDIAQRISYVVIGDYSGPYGDYLYSLAHGPLKGCLYLLGYQSNEMLETFLQKADFCVNLRYPNTEVCSKALIEQMAFENPVIVLDQGVFNEIPNDCIVKIQMENEILELAAAFNYLLDNNVIRQEIGRRALQFVQKNCTPEIYAKRFITFLENIPQTIAIDNLVNDTIRLNHRVLSDLSFNQKSAPWVTDTITRELYNLCRAISVKPSGRKVIGIWFGFPYLVELRREGITRFMLYMLLALLDQYPIDCEIWTYSLNEEEIRISFEPLLNNKEYQNRVHIITEKNYIEILELPSYEYELPLMVNENEDNLGYLARDFSNATCFVTGIVYLDNVIATGKPLFVPVHDLGIHLHYDEFIIKDPLYKARFVDVRSRAENFSRAYAFMFCNSDYVRKEHLLKYISSIDSKRTRVVYLPVNIPSDLEANLLTKEEIRHKFKLNGLYIFYPSQVRPYKNVQLLIEALSLLKKRNIDISLVLTGIPSDVPDVEIAIKKHQIHDQVICITNVLENELYSLYKYAAAAAVPTLFEGGFPWQACEALLMETPLVLSKIPVVQERIESLGMSLEDCGMELFDPHSSLECANALEKVILNRKEILASQKHFRDAFLAYSWKDAAAQYYNMFFNTEKVENE
jgi:glycosyltransferase involved in cell wall biosynthesis